MPAGIPVWIGWIRYISFIYYGFGMLLHHEYQGRTIYSCVDSSLAQAPGAIAMSVQVDGHVLCLCAVACLPHSSLHVRRAVPSAHAAYTLSTLRHLRWRCPADTSVVGGSC